MKHKFITIGEIMLRLTPPDYEKSEQLQPLKQDMGEVRPMWPFPLQILELMPHFYSCAG